MNEVSVKENVSPNKSSQSNKRQSNLPQHAAKRPFLRLGNVSVTPSDDETPSSQLPPVSRSSAKRVLSFLQDESIASIPTKETLLQQLPISRHAEKKIPSSLEVFIPASSPDKLSSKPLITTLDHQDSAEQEMLSRLSVLKEKYQESISAVKISLYANDTAHPAIKLDNDMFMEWLSDKSIDLYGDLARQRIDIQNTMLALYHHRKSSKAAPTPLTSLDVDRDADVMLATLLPGDYAEIANPWYFENEISTLVELNVKTLGDFVANYKYRLAGIGESGTFPDDDGHRYTVFITPAIDTQGVDYIERFKQGDDAGISSINLAYYFDKRTRPLGKMESILQTIMDMLNINKNMDEISAYISHLRSQENLELQTVTMIFAQNNDLATIKNLLGAELDNLLKQQKDIFDEMDDLISSSNACHIKILFPYNITQTHWLLGEIKIHKDVNSHHFVVELTAHDPFGQGSITVRNQIILKEIFEKKIIQLDPLAEMSFSFLPSSYNARQHIGDGDSCGAIVVRDALIRMTGGGLSLEKPFEMGAPVLRREHLQLIQKANEPAVRDRFILRHRLPSFVPTTPTAAVRRELDEQPLTPRVVDTPSVQEQKSIAEGKLVGWSLIDILKSAGHKFLKQDGEFGAEPDKGHVYALSPEFGGNMVVIDMAHQEGDYHLSGSACGDYLCSNNEFLVVKHVNKSIKAMLEGSHKVWQGAFVKFKKNIHPSEVEFVLVLSFKTAIKEEQLKQELGQLFEKLNVTPNEGSFPKFRFLYPCEQKMALSQKYAVADCKKAYSPQKVKYRFTHYPVAAAAANGPAVIYSECKKIFDETVDFDRQFVAKNPLYKLVNGQNDYKSNVKYFLPKELTDISLHCNDLIRTLGNLSTKIDCGMRTSKDDDAAKSLQELQKLVRFYVHNLTFMQQRLKDVQALFLGDEKQEADARQRFIQIKESLLSEFRKTLTASVQSLSANDAIDAWFNSREFTALACISSLLRSFLKCSKKTLEQNVAKLLGFYWMLEHPAAELKPSAGNGVTIPLPILNLVKTEDKEKAMKSNFNAMVRCLADGFSAQDDRQNYLTQKLRYFGAPVSINLRPVIASN
jgi:hypothetical protein